MQKNTELARKSNKGQQRAEAKVTQQEQLEVDKHSQRRNQAELVEAQGNKRDGGGYHTSICQGASQPRARTPSLTQDHFHSIPQALSPLFVLPPKTYSLLMASAKPRPDLGEGGVLSTWLRRSPAGQGTAGQNNGRGEQKGMTANSMGHDQSTA